MANKVGERIKIRLNELHMSQSDLCRKTGINRATMSQYISGKYFPTQKRLEGIAQALNVSPAYLMGWSDMMIQSARDHSLNELIDFVARHDYGNYSYATGDETTDAIGEIISIMLNLDDGRQMELINYAKFLESQEEK